MILGVDLGTTNSSVAVIENGQAVVVRDAGGNDSYPSVVAVSQVHSFPRIHALKGALCTSILSSMLCDPRRTSGSVWARRRLTWAPAPPKRFTPSSG